MNKIPNRKALSSQPTGVAAITEDVGQGPPSHTKTENIATLPPSAPATHHTRAGVTTVSQDLSRAHRHTC